MIRIGLIGCGEHSEIGHAVPLARYQSRHPGRIELTAACDLHCDRAEQFRAKFGFLRHYGDIEEMLAREKLDACIAVVPVSRIATIAIKLLKLGIPCSIEKPLGVSLAEVDTLAEVAESTATPHMVSVNRRFMPFLNDGLRWAESVGPLRYVRATMARHRRTESDFLPTTAVHAVDALRYVAGEVKCARSRPVTADLSARWSVVEMEFENGVIGNVEVLPTAGMLEETYELFGDDFRVIVTAPFGPTRGLRCFRENELVLHSTDHGIPDEVVFGFYDEARAFVEALARGELPAPSIADVYPSVKLCLQFTAPEE